jgi:hypothetical protein
MAAKPVTEPMFDTGPAAPKRDGRLHFRPLVGNASTTREVLSDGAERYVRERLAEGDSAWVVVPDVAPWTHFPANQRPSALVFGEKAPEQAALMVPPGRYEKANGQEAYVVGDGAPGVWNGPVLCIGEWVG